MNLVQSVYDISEQFMKYPSEVSMNYTEIEFIANEMLKEGKTEFPMPHNENPFKAVLIELVASSINYCYWYGKSSVRPSGSSSTFLYENIANAFFDYTEVDDGLQDFYTLGRKYETKFNICLTRLINLLITNRFPLIEERMYHINQLRYSAEEFAQKVINNKETSDLNDLMLELVTLFPGFASDMFLKRTFLFFMQMYRRFGWFSQAIQNIPVAADYQIPKMLEHLSCFSYSTSLKTKIESNTLIPKGSKEECEIRAATVLVCKRICEITGWNIAEVDGYFWLRRKEVTSPFHLTVTTDY